jgi:hypothetical protein
MSVHVADLTVVAVGDVHGPHQVAALEAVLDQELGERGLIRELGVERGRGLIRVVGVEEVDPQEERGLGGLEPRERAVRGVGGQPVGALLLRLEAGRSKPAWMPLASLRGEELVNAAVL